MKEKRNKIPWKKSLNTVWNESYKKNDAFIKIRAEIENKISCIESVPQFVQSWTIFLHATFSSDIFDI